MARTGAMIETAGIRSIEKRHMNSKPRKKRHIACEGIIDFFWDEPEILEFREMWRKGIPIERIAKELNRDPDDVLILIVDQGKRGHIKQRPEGLFGNQKKVL